MKVTLTIQCDNAAFGETGYEQAHQIANVLRSAADRMEFVEREPAAFLVRDSNGNNVCQVAVEK